MTALKDFSQVESYLAALAGNLSPAARKKTLTDIGRYLRRAQMTRIIDQKNPDGSPYIPRKRKLPMKKIFGATRFLYPSGGNGEPRVVFMKQWTFSGPDRITGFDIERNGERSFVKSKIIKYLDVAPHEENKGAGTFRKRTIREQAMFKKIRGPRFLKAFSTADDLSVGFSSRTATIAASHQYGNRKQGKPPRLLLGLSPADEDQIIDRLLEMVTEGLPK